MADFYAILGISRAAETDEIAKAYRRAALTYNPAQPDSAANTTTSSEYTPAELARRFRLVSQAYVVLSDPRLRAVYDAYGESGVRHGGTIDPNPLDIDAIDPDAVFRRFFGVDSPFQMIGDISGLHSTQHRFFAESAAAKAPAAAAAAHVDVSITLEEVATGTRRSISWKRHNDTSSAAAATVVAIPAGIESGSSMVLPLTGGPVELRVTVLPHPHYERRGSDLIHTVPIALVDALTGTTVTVPLLGADRTSQLRLDEVAHPDFYLRLPGEGLPDRETGKKGDLLVKFAARYPAYLTADQKKELRRILTTPE